jgi:hypothetical protein
MSAIKNIAQCHPRLLPKTESAGQHIPPQAPVAKKAESRVCEGGGLVMFKEEMPDPGESIALHEGCYN